MQIDVESLNSREVRHGWLDVPVGSPSRLTPRQPAHTAKGVVLYAPSDNTVPIYWGVTDTIQADRSPQGGIELAPGRSFTVPVNDPSEIFVVATETEMLGWVSL